MKKLTSTFVGIGVALLLLGCAAEKKTDASTDLPETNIEFVSQGVIDENNKTTRLLDFDNRTDFDLADRGFLGTLDETLITTKAGLPAYDFGAYAFLDGDAPDSVNPSLWRQSQLNAKHGLFEVVDGIYQVRGYDLSNITFIKGDTGWIVVDPLISKETAEAARKLVDEKLGVFPIKAVVFTHSHADHFGGVRGIISDEDIAGAGVAVRGISEVDALVAYLQQLGTLAILQQKR